MSTIELGPAGQDGDSFNMDETRQIWEAIERASENGETTVILISGDPAATLGPPPVRPGENDLETAQQAEADAKEAYDLARREVDRIERTLNDLA